jgi:hypothetical protein
MLTKQQVFETYGNLQLQHTFGEDCAYRYVFAATADDGAQIQVIHSSNIYIWEDYVRTDRPVTLNIEPDYHLMRIIRNGELLYEEQQSHEY